MHAEIQNVQVRNPNPPDFFRGMSPSSEVFFSAH